METKPAADKAGEWPRLRPSYPDGRFHLAD
jgi:hypothetical protein